MSRQNSTFGHTQEPLVFQPAPLPHYVFQGLPLRHAVFTRYGGVSQGPYQSLNLSYEVGDAPERVHENRKRIKDLLGCRALLSAKQVHGNEIFVAEDLSSDLEVEGFDVLVTTSPQVGLLIKQADCQAVILWSSRPSVLALAHAGWRGLVQWALPKTVSFLKKEFRVPPEELYAAISPSLQPCCAEFKTWREIFPQDFARFQVRPAHFDLPGISVAQLLQAGLRRERILVSRKCTCCETEFFSYRREKVSGRFGTLACLEPT